MNMGQQIHKHSFDELELVHHNRRVRDAHLHKVDVMRGPSSACMTPQSGGSAKAHINKRRRRSERWKGHRVCGEEA